MSLGSDLVHDFISSDLWPPGAPCLEKKAGKYDVDSQMEVIEPSYFLHSCWRTLMTYINVYLAKILRQS